MEILSDLAIVIGMGLLIGLEREYSHLVPGQGLFAGVRTFPLVCLLGYLSALLGKSEGYWIFAIAFLAVIALVSISYFTLSQRNDIGATTEVSFILTFILGALVFRGEVLLAVSAAVLITVLLSIKLQVLSALGKFGQPDFFALLKFVIMAAIILPVLPDTQTGPYLAINPRQIGYVIVLISGISFFGYVLTKLKGSDKGIQFAAILGGIVSSTALTWDFSKKSREDPDHASQYATGIVLACSIMYLRVLLIVYLLNPALGVYLSLPAGLLGVGGLFTGKWLMKGTEIKPSQETFTISNPLNIRNAVTFAVLFSVVGILVQAGKSMFGESGIFLVGALSGLTDVDAIVLSMVNYAGSDAILAKVAVVTMLIGMTVNTLFKFSLALFNGNGAMKKIIWKGVGSLILGSAMAVVVIWLV